MNRGRTRVRVDRDLCVGNAMCRAMAPRAFVADSSGLSVVADPDAEGPAALWEAADNCPVEAIEIHGIER